MLPRWQLRSGEKRGDCVGLTKKGKGTKCMVLVDGQGTPLGVHLDTANSAEVCLAEATLDTVQLEDEQGSRCQPERVIADRAFDSNRLRHQLWQRGIEPVIPARKNNNRATDQDGRKLRRYARRWLVERTIAWLGNFRRLLIRYDRFLRSYAGFVHLACVVITLKMVLK
jgi:transposase